MIGTWYSYIVAHGLLIDFHVFFMCFPSRQYRVQYRCETLERLTVVATYSSFVLSSCENFSNKSQRYVCTRMLSISISPSSWVALQVETSLTALMKWYANSRCSSRRTCSSMQLTVICRLMFWQADPSCAFWHATAMQDNTKAELIADMATWMGPRSARNVTFVSYGKLSAVGRSINPSGMTLSTHLFMTGMCGVAMSHSMLFVKW